MRSRCGSSTMTSPLTMFATNCCRKTSPDDQPRVHPAVMRLWNQSWSQISAPGMIGGQCPQCWRGEHVIIRRRRSSQRSVETNMRRFCAKPSGRDAFVGNSFSRGRVSSAVSLLSWCCESSSSSLHAQGVNKCSFLSSDKPIRERRKEREQVDLKEQHPVCSCACARASVRLCVAAGVCVCLWFLHGFDIKLDCTFSAVRIIYA